MELHDEIAPQKTLQFDKKKDIIDDLLKSPSDIEDEEEEAKDKQKKRKRKRLAKARDFDEYSYNIPHIELKSNVVVSQKLMYILNEALSDLGFNNILSVNFWLSLIILLLAMWVRAFLHIFGSWLMLEMLGIPVTTFTPMMYLIFNLFF